MTTAAQTVLAYHQRTKHRLDRYAAGPDTLDWDAQPNPFREFIGAPRVQLPLRANDDPLLFSDLPAAQPQPFSLKTLAYLLELSMGLAAWKEYGPDRWALRCTPSSGNLHPTECYVLAFGIAGLDDGLYHYLPREHALEHRWYPVVPATAPKVSIGLSSIHWREAWKYGERAFRYCQLDIGHAVGALRYAAAVVGWSIRLDPTHDSDRLAALLGLDHPADFEDAEREDPELLLDVIVPGISPEERATFDDLGEGHWFGHANRLDPHPMYHWPIIEQVAKASRQPVYPSEPPADIAPWPARTRHSSRPATDVIRGRRSAQHFNPKATMPAETFFQMLDSLLPRPNTRPLNTLPPNALPSNTLPWDSLPFAPHVHVLLFVHRVTGLEPGLYVLPRSEEGETYLRDQLHHEFDWNPPKLDGAAKPEHLPLYLLMSGDVRKAARGFSCHQAIAADSCFSLALIAEFAPLITDEPWRYRPLFWEAGLIGQTLYLEAEAAGFNGTGIGCFFDDAVHESIGLKDNKLQVLYHFTVGQALVDSRISTLPPYAHRTPAPPSNGITSP
jgi:nitroreductase